MTTAKGLLAKAAFRVAPSDGIEINNANYKYPKDVADATTYNNPALGNHDMIPLMSEGIADNRDYETDETLEGSPAVSEIDLISSLPAGSLSIAGKYEGLDALIACGMGMEIPTPTNSPSFPNATALTAGTCAAGTFVANASVFAAGDVGKFITITSGTGQHQVRRISGYNSGTSVNVTPNWGTTPTAADTASMNQTFLHKFELSENLNVEDWVDAYSAYSDTGVLTDTDKIARFGSLGFQKQVTDWIYRAVMVNGFSITMKANTSAELSFDMVAFDLIKGSYHGTDWEYNLSPNFPAINPKVIFKNGALYVAAYSESVSLDSDDELCSNGFTINLNNNLKSDDQSFCSGVNRMEPARGGMREVAGTIEVPRYADNTLVNWKENQAKLMGKLVLTGGEIETGFDFKITIWLPTFKLIKGQPNVSDAGALSQTFDWMAYMPTGAASGFPTQYNTIKRGELIIETQNMNPFNIFLNQNKEY